MARAGAQEIFVEVWISFETQVEILGVVNVSICEFQSDTVIHFILMGGVLPTSFWPLNFFIYFSSFIERKLNKVLHK